MKKRRVAKKTPPLLSVLIVVFCLLVFFGSLYLESQPAHAPAESAASSAPDGSLEVHFLDIGQGDSALLFCGEETMLIDGGKVKNNQKLISRLKALNVTHLDAVICSHPDEDHCGGLAAVLAGTQTDTFYCSVDSWHTKAFSDVVKYANEQGVSVTVPTPGDIFSFGGRKRRILRPCAGLRRRPQ